MTFRLRPMYPFENKTPMREETYYGSWGSCQQFAGMTLRDYFAADVINGICASGPTRDWSSLDLAREAYSIADAMIKVRDE